MNTRVLFALLTLGLPACTGTTGSSLVTFDAASSGPAEATGTSYAFTSGRGYDVVLSRANLHVGAVYLNRAKPISGEQSTECVLPGIYVGEVTGGLDVNLLSPKAQPFPTAGEGTADRAVVGQVWLVHGDVNAPDDTEPVLDIAGTASRDTTTIAFEGSLTIGKNRASAATDPALPSASPICRQRIVSPISVALTPREGGTLHLQIDPRGFFDDVEFTSLTTVSSQTPLVYRFDDDDQNQADRALYEGLRATGGVYSLSFTNKATP